MRTGSQLLSLLFAAAVAALTACQPNDNPTVKVRITSGPVVNITVSPQVESETLHFVFASVLTPDRSNVPYQRFARYLGVRLGRPVEILRRRTYTEMNELLRSGTAQAGVVCTGAYAIGREQFDLGLLVVPTVKERSTYKSFLIVRRGSGRHTLLDLRGLVFAFSDPLSNSGYRYIADRLLKKGTTPRHFFQSTIFTYSHDNTIQAVRDGIADAGSVNSLIWERMVVDVPSVAGELEVIEESPEFPMNPVVVSPHMPPEEALLLKKTLLAMRADEAAKGVLDALGISGFTDEIDEGGYDAVAESWRALGAIAASSGRRRP